MSTQALPVLDSRIQAEQALCQLNPLHHIEKHFYIKDGDGELRPIRKLKLAQLKLLALYFWCKQQEIPVRIIILKARKEGLSTLVQILMQIEALERGIDAVVIAHDSESTKDIFRIGERCYRNYDLPKPALQRGNVGELKFKDHEGHIQVLTAGNELAGTGLTPQFLHCSEAAKWKKGSETATALFQSVAKSPKTTIIVECTAYGYDSLFKPMWDSAHDNCRVAWSLDPSGIPIPKVEITNKDEWNNYIPLFIPWFEDPQYSETFEYVGESEFLEQTLTAQEQSLIDRFGVNLEQINAYRNLLKEKCQKDPQIRFQEYPSTPREAFIHSGRPKFNIEILDQMAVEPFSRGMLTPAARMSRRLEFVPDSTGDTYIREHPIQGFNYIIGVDVAEGKIPDGQKKPDGTVVLVHRARDGVQVAKMYGQISEEALVEPLLLLMEYYNGAWTTIESNSSGKHVCIEVGKKYPKSRLYCKNDEFDDKGRRNAEIGFRTGNNRRIAVGRLASYLDDRQIVFHDEQTIQEHRTFHISTGGKPEAMPGCHDDHVSAAWLVCIGMASFPHNLKPYHPYMKDGGNFPRNYRYGKRASVGRRTRSRRAY